MNFYAGIDIGGTYVKMGIIDALGKIYEYEKESTAIDKIGLMKQIAHFINKFNSYDIKGVGISTPGIITKDGYAQTSGDIKCFFKQNIKKALEDYLNLPVVVENDGKSAGLAEKWIGAAKHIDDFVCLTLGTAIGGSIFIDGQLRRGIGGLAGEFGVALTSLNDYTDEASYAYHAATVGGLCRQYSYAMKERVLDAEEIIRRAFLDDKIAIQCLEDFYQAVAVLIVNISVMFAPHMIFIGGGISENTMVMQKIKERYLYICQEYKVLNLIEMPKLKTCELKNHAGMIGAVYAFIVEQKNF